MFKFFRSFYHYLKVTFFAFASNVFLYTWLKPRLGINLSGFIAEISGTLILYTILRKTRKAKIKRKLFGLSFQYFITAITIIINIICLNILNSIYINYLLNHSLFFNLSETYISIISKGISSLIGLIWSSSMTILFAFDFQKSK
tara:strand:+ start:388 stop:819 length:432 start_codon:yes stop_codon:yes gene_type:complete